MDEYKSRKKINKLSEIYDGESLLLREFVNLDLSNLDLSSIPMEQWENCFFYNTSFKNTGIKFLPNRLADVSASQITALGLPDYYKFGKKIMCFCDFSDNDFSWLTKDDFCIGRDNEIDTNGCDFTNTKINFLKTLINVKLDESYKNYGFFDDYWKFNYGTVNWPDFIDINTIVKNPFLNVPSFRALNAIAHYVFQSNQSNIINTATTKPREPLKNIGKK